MEDHSFDPQPQVDDNEWKEHAVLLVQRVITAVMTIGVFWLAFAFWNDNYNALEWSKWSKIWFVLVVAIVGTNIGEDYD